VVEWILVIVERSLVRDSRLPKIAGCVRNLQVLVIEVQMQTNLGSARVAASLQATAQTSQGTDTMAVIAVDIDRLVTASQHSAITRTGTIIMVHVGRPIAVMPARATMANNRVITITAGIGRVIIATHQVGLNLPRAIVVPSMRTTLPVLMTNPPVAKGLFLHLTRN
jgi:hypothetical protein